MMYAIYIAAAYILSFFLNVIVYRIPNEKPLFKGESICPHCGEPVKWYYHLPIIGFFIGHKYKCCGEKMALRNILLPIFLMGLFAMAVWMAPTVYKLMGEKSYLDNASEILCILMCGFVAVLLVVFFVDMETMMIPDRCHLAIIILAILLMSFGYVVWWVALISGAAYFVIFYFIGFIGEKLSGKEALGGGDIKLMGAVGFFLGFGQTLLGLIIGCILCLILEMVLVKMKFKEKGYFAFGPYLALGMIVSLFFGLQIIDWYESLMGMA